MNIYNMRLMIFTSGTIRVHATEESCVEYSLQMLVWTLSERTEIYTSLTSGTGSFRKWSKSLPGIKNSKPRDATFREKAQEQEGT